MEETILVPCVLGLLLLPILAVLMALCVHCHRLPGSYDSTSSDSLYPRGIQIKRPYTLAPRPPTYPPVTSYPALSQPDLLPIPRSPQPPGGSHRTPSSRRDSDGANSVPSYENEEPACEDADEDEDEDDYRNPGYLVVLPDSAPAASTAAPPAPVLSTPGLRDSAFSTLLCDRPYLTEKKTEAQRGEVPGLRLRGCLVLELGLNQGSLFLKPALPTFARRNKKHVKEPNRPGSVAHTCNPSTLGGPGGRII
ncbi:linker for activation of T-cells family member 1 isoform X3 [Aotus nancymaae]|uniref:linker for activation of T-cells family member 1 isoform X3 n=1 Tax=Aotus nancymaae TaxID=37293 RepID=UPI0030FECB73